MQFVKVREHRSSRTTSVDQIPTFPLCCEVARDHPTAVLAALQHLAIKQKLLVHRYHQKDHQDVAKSFELLLHPVVFISSSFYSTNQATTAAKPRWRPSRTSSSPAPGSPASRRRSGYTGKQHSTSIFQYNSVQQSDSDRPCLRLFDRDRVV